MVKRIDSDALGILGKSLGLSGTGSQLTELFDGTVDQVLDIGPCVRRGRTQAATDGIYTAIMRNVHTDAQTLTNVNSIYRMNSTIPIAPWPNPMPAGFDIWLLQASLAQVSGGGTLAATLSVRYVAQQGWGRTNGGGTVVSALANRLAHWDAIVADSSSFGVLAGSEEPTAKIGLRLPRGATELIFVSTSSLTVTWDLQLVLGVFPVALDQDGVV